ncbi:hypothetical protein QP849_00915 [Alloscardovia omnicolens]|uniref:hypothetical protein n=1 Tax=Alloscardovia omnicolens TaxID=419015 RepID=UPI00255176BE|nr:hypothetical protein [Alloscardovia omnicolens]MDK8648981.1 hypothetical protein [Alloscardovia omnicolens]
MYNQAPDDVYVTLIRTLMMDQKIDIQTAQTLIKSYQELHTPPAPIEELTELRDLEDLEDISETNTDAE